MTKAKFAPWITRDRKVVLDKGKFLKIEQHTVELPDGRVIDDWQWVITPDYVNIVAVTGDGRYLCFRQTKYAVKGPTLALVGGYMEPGEKPLAAAQRELREETGYEAAAWTPLGEYAVDANRGVGRAHFYLATAAGCLLWGHVGSLIGARASLLAAAGVLGVATLATVRSPIGRLPARR